jgi:hypothetical protein
MKRRPLFTYWIAGTRDFDFNHIRAEIAKQHCAIWTRKKATEIDYFDAAQGLGIRVFVFSHIRLTGNDGKLSPALFTPLVDGDGWALTQRWRTLRRENIALALGRLPRGFAPLR